MIYTAFFVVAIFSPFLFPWQYAVLITAFSSWRYPFAALAVGIEFDVLYAVSNGSFVLFGTLIGGSITIMLFFIRHIMQIYVRNSST